MFAVASHHPLDGRHVSWPVRERAGDTIVAARRFFAAGSPQATEAVRIVDEYVAVCSGRPVEPQTPGSENAAPAKAAIRSILQVLQEKGASALGRYSGPFSVIAWNERAAELVAVRDALGIAPLFYAEHGSEICLSDDLDMFGRTSDYDTEFIAEFIARRGVCVNRSIWRSVRPVPAGHALRWDWRGLRVERCWTPTVTYAAERRNVNGAREGFRRLIEEAVLANVEPHGATWAHLSGGLDSSSVVSVAGRAHREGRTHSALGGTLTLVDSLGNGDEREFSNAVLESCGLPNLQILDEWPWRSDGEPPPVTDRPARDYPFYARDRRIGRALRERGATSLLSGIGPDHYLATTTAHIPDLFWSMDFKLAARELYRWSYSAREPLLRTAFREVLRPLCLPSVVAATSDTHRTVRRCLTKRFYRRETVDALMRHRRAGPRGEWFPQHILSALSKLAGWVPGWCHMPGIDVRHPLLHLPLVEWCLSLPYHLRTDVYYSKPILRAALEGTLPEKVRRRTTKGSVLEPRICWSFMRERKFLERLLSEPVLGDLQCIEPREVLNALDACGRAGGSDGSYLYCILSLETWLSTKSGRWSRVKSVVGKGE